MGVGINSHFKILLGHFFIAGLSGSERANVIRIALQKIHETGARGVTLTCDGPASHFTMLRELGVFLDPNNLKPYFQHPADKHQRVYTFLDLVHALKLVRNIWASQKVLVSPSGLVQWHFIERLHQLQKEEGLRAGTKLTKKHVEWGRNKMKCSLAAHVLSKSVAAAIDFCREDLKLPEFQNSGPTTEFIRLTWFTQFWAYSKYYYGSTRKVLLIKIAPQKVLKSLKVRKVLITKICTSSKKP